MNSIAERFKIEMLKEYTNKEFYEVVLPEFAHLVEELFTINDELALSFNDGSIVRISHKDDALVLVTHDDLVEKLVTIAKMQRGECNERLR